MPGAGVTSRSPEFAVITGDDSLAVRPADAADQSFIRHLFKVARAESFAAAQLPPVALEAVLEQQFRAQSAFYAAQFPDAVSLLIARHHEPIGRLILRRDPQRWHIIDVVLLPAARGRGIGSGIIHAVTRAAREQGACELTLTVLASNVAARRLYARLGFFETGQAASGGTYVAMALRLGP